MHDANTLGAWLAGTLPEAERAAIEHHATVCDRCHALVQDLADTAGLALHAAVARLRLAELVAGSEGEALRAAAQAYAEREQVTALDAVTEHLAPGFPGG
jgi:anti-sigma factor RsiW